MSEKSKKNPFLRFLSQNLSVQPHNQDNNNSNNSDIASGGQRVEETYRMLQIAVEQSIDGIAMATIDGIVQFCNEAWAKMHGYQIYEIIGKHLSIFHTGEQLERDVIPFHEKVKENDAYHGEVGHLKKDGTIFSTWMSTTLLKDKDGNPLGFVGIARDITERKRTKEELVISEEKYRKLFENSIEGIGLYWLDRFISANKTLLYIFGYDSLEEFVKVPMIYHVALEYRNMFKERMKKREMGAKVEPRFDFQIIRRDGQLRSVEVSTTEIFIGDQKYVQGTFRDITERKEAEGELRKSQEKYKTLTENINVGLYRNTSGAKGKFLEANSTMVKMFGYQDKEEFLSLRVYDLYQNSAERRMFSEKLSEQGFVKSEELLLKKKDGALFIGCVSAVAIKDEYGRVQYFDGVVEDITERKELERVLHHSEMQYRSTIDSMESAIHVVDRQLKFVLFNNAFKNWNQELGLDTDVIGKSIFEVFPFLSDHVKQEYLSVFTTRKILVTEELHKFNGKELYTETRKIPIFAGNEIKQVVTVVRDVTERKKADGILLSKERFMSNIFSSIQDGISILDDELNIVRVNPKMEEWYSHSMPLVGKKCYKAYHCRNKPCEVCPTTKALKTKISAYDVVPKTSAGGEIVGWIGLYAFPLFDIETGKMQGVIEYVRDITDRKKAEDRISEINDCLLNFGSDSYKNINSLVSLANKLMGADCALYNRLQGDLLYTVGRCNLPEDFNILNKAEGHLCSDVIKQKKYDDLFVVKDLPHSIYAKTDPSVLKYNLQTYVGIAVRSKDLTLGSLCVIYKKDFTPNQNDTNIMQIISSAITVEEKRLSTKEALLDSEKKYKFLFEQSGVFSLIVDTNFKIKDVNITSVEKLGYSKDEVMGKNVLGFIVRKDREKAIDELRKAFSENRRVDLEIDVYAKDKIVHTLLFKPTQVIFYENNKPVSMLFSGVDITEIKKVRERQISIAEGLSAVVEVADKLITCPDLDSLFLRAVELGREKLGLERCAIFVEEDGYVQGYYGTDRYGRTTDEHGLRFKKDEYWSRHLRRLNPEDPKWILGEGPRIEWDGKKAVQIDEGWIVLTSIQSAQRPIGVFVNDAAISKSDVDPIKQDTLAVFCSLLGNIFERKRAEKELAALNKELFKSNKRFKQMAFRDSHTGLYNHRFLNDSIESEFNRAIRYKYPLSVVMLDLDYFKSINDAYSHQFGDLVLKQFARQIKMMVRKYDIIVRFGGEEFLILCPGIDKVTSLGLAQRILTSINSYNFGNNQYNTRLKLSIAVVSYPENKVVRGIDLVQLVDKVLNKAKEDGGNRVYSSLDLKEPKNKTLENGEDNPDVSFLRNKISKLNIRANQSLIESVFAFARTIKLKDHYTGEHVEHTVHFAMELAHKVGLSRSEIENVKGASMLHDLGKIGVSEKILLKKSKLSNSEFNHIKKHPQIGADILRPIQSLHNIIPLVLSHHERWDGRGYPNGLKQEEIPLGARIVAISDVYQALTSDRPYRKAYPKEKAKEIIHEGSGTQFDPVIVDLFLKVVE
ncbi:MAG: PAS domain S-box protein [Candidatus Omnitrophota bacterium]